jgi:two-component system sensor histidine kinase KdpD
VTWLAGWAIMLALDRTLDLANLALVLVLTSAIASLWLPGGLSAVAAMAAVLAFNWTFVPPRFAFTVDLRQHALLLIAMLLVNWIISGLVIRQRTLRRAAHRSAQSEQRLRRWGDSLRDTDDPITHAAALLAALRDMSQGPVAVLLQPAADSAEPVLLGEPDADQRAGLALCARESRPLGPGTGRYQEQSDVYLPLRGRSVAFGAAVLVGVGRAMDADDIDHAQALCDQMGQALQRADTTRREREARDHAHDQGVRNALLAAVSHDYRTPLATIMSAASSLEQQGDRLGAEQRLRLAAAIGEEARRLSRLTDNTLQLARLDAPGVELRCDWESAEEIVGTTLRHLRRRSGGANVHARVEPGLPLLWCDAILLSQLLDNLVDNALKYGRPGGPVEIVVVRCDALVQLSVRDRGPGIAPAWRDKVFDAFRRGAAPASAEGAGAGVGLAVCRAIARAHGGELTVRARNRGGASFDCRLPLRSPPSPPTEEMAS